MCLYPRILINRKYTSTKKNGGNIPYLWDRRIKYVPIGCGVCEECVKKRARDWRIRMTEELKTNPNGWYFVTLTFSDESLLQLCKKYDTTECNAIATKAVRLFLERYRKEMKKSAKHWLITELGHNGTERIHLHGLIQASPRLIEKHWKYGFVSIDQTHETSERTVNYILKYITKTDIDHKGYIPIVLCSPGIGKNYISTAAATINRMKYDNDGVAITAADEYRYHNGRTTQLPIYYRNHLYTETERELLWIEKIDKDERYIGGVCVKNASKNEKLCDELRAAAQEKSIKNGYPSKSNWLKNSYNVTNRKLNQKNLERNRKKL